MQTLVQLVNQMKNLVKTVQLVNQMKNLVKTVQLVNQVKNLVKTAQLVNQVKVVGDYVKLRYHRNLREVKSPAE